MNHLTRTCLVAGSMATCFGAAAASGGDAELRATMRDLFTQIRIVLPLALDDESFADPDNHDRVSRALEALRSHSKQLALHGRAKDAGFVFQSDSLAQRADTIARRYALGDSAGARHLLRRSLSDCVACHSKLPTAHEFPMGQLLLAEVDLESLSARERARIQVVARQFEEALASYEAMFGQLGAVPSSRDMVEYLKICLAIENDAPRASKTLTRLSARPDLPAELVRDSEIWITSIQRLQSEPLEAEPIERARALLGRADAAELEPPSRGDLVYLIEAWHELQRFVAVSDSASARLAEAYYLMGRVESRMGPYGSISASPYLEAAIRVAPNKRWGRPAFALLEELTILGYTGSGGTHVPADVQAKLNELERSLGDAAPH